MSDLIKDAVNFLSGMFTKHHQDLVRHLRTPTPQKVTVNVTADASGNIGGGFANPNPVLLYQCPMSHEAWIHRITIQSPNGTPKAPLTVGQLAFVGGSGELFFFLPVSGSIAPVIMAEGYASAAHLNAGGKVNVYGDSFAAGVSLRIDLQLSFITGVSEYTPLDHFSEKEQILE